MQISLKAKRGLLAIARRFGFDIIKGQRPEAAILLNNGINLIFDVGANAGQYALNTRTNGYKGQIVSSEPISSVFNQLKAKAKNDHLWTTLNFGLGDYDGTASINISEYSVFSSILNQLPQLSEQYSDSKYIGKEEITIRQLDTVFSDYYHSGDKVLLKIDTQGYEKKVLAGARNSLKHITGIRLELSFGHQYEGELLIMDMINLLQKDRFTLVYLEPLQHTLNAGKMLQADGIFLRL